MHLTLLECALCFFSSYPDSVSQRYTNPDALPAAKYNSELLIAVEVSLSLQLILI